MRTNAAGLIQHLSQLTVIAAAGSFGKGRSIAWMSDIGPHWLPPTFCEWEGYPLLWRNALGWVTNVK
jgi:uncharacterized membrane protein